MLVTDFSQSLLAFDVIANQIHRARPIKRNQRNDVVDLSNVELPRRAGHPAGLHLEEANGFAAVIERKRFCVIQRNILQRKIRLAFANERQRVFDHSQCL